MLARSLVVLFVVNAAGACAQTPPGADASDPAGCYRFEHGAWPDSLDHLPSADLLPDRLRLASDPFLIGVGPLGGPVEQVRPSGLGDAHAVRYAGVPKGGGAFAYWHLRDGELFLGRYLPTFGFYLTATPAGAGWTGTLTGFTDAIPADRKASESVDVRLVRRPCEGAE